MIADLDREQNVKAVLVPENHFISIIYHTYLCVNFIKDRWLLLAELNW